MSVTPPTISPRLRSREAIATKAAASAVVASPPLPRVLIRLPNLAPAKSNASRFPFAASLFSTLKRKYAAAAFAVFVVSMAAMLLHGRHKTLAPDDGGTEAPRWNGSVTALPKNEGSAAPLAQSNMTHPGNGNAMTWPAAQQTPADAQRGSGPYANSWPQSNGVAPPGAAASYKTPAAGDAIPSMPLHNPSPIAVAERNPPWQSPPADTGYRPAPRNDITPPDSRFGRPNSEQPDVAHLDGTIRPQEQPSGYTGPQNNR